ncbi:MAG: hypothetical protein LBT64_03995, partial [Puniceicoccales bacterium]|nr:hypothetical protein [Puniceicoccales bacterium]
MPATISLDKFSREKITEKLKNTGAADFSLKIRRPFVYASGGQGRSPLHPRIRTADADRFAREDGNLRK